MSRHRPAEVNKPGLDTAAITQLLGLEALAIKVTTTLSERGIDALLIKGPVTNRWLYGDALSRQFSDIDLLVAPASLRAAEVVLRGLNFRNYHADILAIYRPDYESAWLSNHGVIDLHTRLGGVPAAAASIAWSQLWQHSSDFTLHGRTTKTLGINARIMLLGLHAARSKFDRRALVDLHTGLSRFPDAAWHDAANLATQLEAGACFALGLRQSNDGRALLSRLRYDPMPTMESLLLERGASQAALVVASTFASGGPRWAAVARWLSTESDGRPPLRARLAAAARFPSALLSVFIARRSLHRVSSSNHA